MSSGRSAGSGGGRTRTCAFDAGVLRGVRDHVHAEPPLATVLLESVPGDPLAPPGGGTPNRATQAALAGRPRKTGMTDHLYRSRVTSRWGGVGPVGTVARPSGGSARGRRGVTL